MDSAGAVNASRKPVAATKRQRTAAVQDAGAHSFAPRAVAAIATWLASFAIALFPIASEAAEAPGTPEITKVEPFVWSVGSTNAVTIEGRNFGNVRRLWTSRHGVLTAAQLTAAVEDEGKRLNLTAPVDGREASGPFAVRVITDGGISAPVMALLEELPELKPSTNALLSGTGYLMETIRTGAGNRHRVRLKQNEKITFEVVAGRFGSKLDPVLRVLDARGKEVFHGQDTAGLGVDCRASLVATTAGEHTLEIRDAAYESGTQQQYQLRLLRGAPATRRLPTSAVRGDAAAPPLFDGLFRGPAETNLHQLKIDRPGSYRFTATSRRLGGACDPVLRLKSADGARLKDSHFFNLEPVISHEFKEPGTYLLESWDAAGQFGPDATYVVTTELGPAEFALNTEIDSLRIPVGGEVELSVTIDRDGYDGPVRFGLAHGPEGVELTDAVAKEKTKEAKFKIKLASSLTPGTTFPLKISGRRGEGENAPKTPLYTSAYWKKRFPDLYSPMFEFEDTVWVTVLPAKD